MIMIADSNEKIKLFIDMGGATAVAKVENKWPGNHKIQNVIGHLSNSIAAHFHRWAKKRMQTSDTLKKE